jgi:hypothetical protein
MKDLLHLQTVQRAYFILSKKIYKNTSKGKATDSERETIIEMHNLFLCFPTPKLRDKRNES